MDITLALGAGGPRGAAHIGVLRVLDNNGFRVRAIAGTSIGSVIAALFAAGRTPDELESIFTELEYSRLGGRLLSDGAGLLAVRGVASWLEEQLGAELLGHLKIPCAVVAVDLRTHAEVTLTDGPATEAVLGSIAIPGLFPPRDYPPYLLVDGGVLDPVPVRAARGLAPNLPVVAVTLHTPMDAPGVSFSSQIPMPPSLVQRITRLALTQTFDVLFESADIATRQLAALRLKLDAPDAIIHPDVGQIRLLDRISVPEIAARGAQATVEALPQLRANFSPRARLRRALLWSRSR
jgi:NTE family protein